MRKFVLAIAALASLAPVAASAQPGYGRGGYDGGNGRGGYDQGYRGDNGYRGDRGDRVRECFRNVRYARNRWEAERRRDFCQRLAQRGRGGYGGYDDRGRGRGW